MDTFPTRTLSVFCDDDDDDDHDYIILVLVIVVIIIITTLLANAQRDGHPAKYRWRHLFNAAKFG